MNKKKAHISVLMPVYNAEKFVGTAIQSVLDQTMQDFELIIINDGSSDNTMSVVSGFSDDRILVLEQEHQGIAAALNFGLRHASAELIARFDADDVCLPTRLETQYHFMQEHLDHAVCGGEADYVEVDEAFVFRYQAPAHTSNEIQLLPYPVCPFIHSTVMFRKQAVMEAGGYSVHAVSFEDHFLWRRLLKIHKGSNLAIPLIQVRLNADSITIDERWRSKKFLRLRDRVLRTGDITESDGSALKKILDAQNTNSIKQGAYYALLGKKYLWNNYDPTKARQNIRQAIRFNPKNGWSYLLLLLSFLPEKLVRKIYAYTPRSNNRYSIQEKQ